MFRYILCPVPVRGSVQRAGEGAGFLSGCWRAGADERHPRGGRRTVELQREIRKMINVREILYIVVYSQ